MIFGHNKFITNLQRFLFIISMEKGSKVKRQFLKFMLQIFNRLGHELGWHYILRNLTDTQFQFNRDKILIFIVLIIFQIH